MKKITHPDQLRSGDVYTFEVMEGSTLQKKRAQFTELGLETGVSRTELVVRIRYSVPAADGGKPETINDYLFWKQIVKVREG